VSAAVLVGDEADHVFLIVDMSAVHGPWMGRARGLRRFSKREVRAWSRACFNRSWEAPNPLPDNFPAEMRHGAPQVDRSVDKLTAFVSVGERTRRGVRAARPLSSQLGTVARTPTNVSVAAHRSHDYAGVV